MSAAFLHRDDSLAFFLKFSFFLNMFSKCVLLKNKLCNYTNTSNKYRKKRETGWIINEGWVGEKEARRMKCEVIREKHSCVQSSLEDRANTCYFFFCTLCSSPFSCNRMKCFWRTEGVYNSLLCKMGVTFWYHCIFFRLFLFRMLYFSLFYIRVLWSSR